MQNEVLTSYECMLSTFDNPFNPFEQFDEWHRFDKDKGYDSCERVARIAAIAEDMTEKEVDVEVERAIDEIIKYDFMNVYKKVTRKLTDN